MRQCIIFLLIIIALPCYGAGGNSFEPWDYNRVDKPAPHEEPVNSSSRFLIGNVRFYQEYISPVSASHCPMYPSCSAYSIQAIRKHGFCIGIMMTIDRLIHEMNEMDTTPFIDVGDELKFFDPVENNDFWWYKKMASPPSDDRTAISFE